MKDNLDSNWEISTILESLPESRRVDDGRDLLACGVKGAHASRTAYIYLYGENPDEISYDLEDIASDSKEWDSAVHRGKTESLEELCKRVQQWLAKTD